MEGVGTMNPTQNPSAIPGESRLIGWFRIAPDGWPSLVRKPQPEPESAPTVAPATDPGPDLKAMTQEEFCSWALGGKAEPVGYALTDAAHAVLDEAPAVEAPGTAARVLRAATLYLERYGWIQGAYYDATAASFTPAACMVGAIGMVCYGGPVDAPAQHFDDPGFLDFEEAVLHLDRYLLVEDGSESYEFNDAKGRRVEDVLHALRQAADTTAEELIDAIRAIDQKNTDIAAIAQLLTPCGIWGEHTTDTDTDGGDRR
jgi:hypothetical protein